MTTFRIPRENSFPSFKAAAEDNYIHGGMLYCTMAPDPTDNLWYNLYEESELTEFYNGRIEQYKDLSSKEFFYLFHMNTLRYAKEHRIEGCILEPVDTFPLFCNNLIEAVHDLPRS